MNRVGVPRVRAGFGQFGIADLLECTATCAVVAAFSAAVGPAAVGFLMAMAVALFARQGLPAIAMLAAATLSADCVPPGQTAGNAAWPHESAVMLVIILAAVLACWYCFRRGYAVSKRRFW